MKVTSEGICPGLGLALSEVLKRNLCEVVLEVELLVSEVLGRNLFEVVLEVELRVSEVLARNLCVRSVKVTSERRKSRLKVNSMR